MCWVRPSRLQMNVETHRLRFVMRLPRHLRVGAALALHGISRGRRSRQRPKSRGVFVASALSSACGLVPPQVDVKTHLLRFVMRLPKRLRVGAAPPRAQQRPTSHRTFVVSAVYVKTHLLVASVSSACSFLIWFNSLRLDPRILRGLGNLGLQ